MSWGIWDFKTCRGSWLMKEDVGEKGSEGKEKLLYTIVLVATHCTKRQLWYRRHRHQSRDYSKLTYYCEWQHHSNKTQPLLQAIFICQIMKFHWGFSTLRNGFIWFLNRNLQHWLASDPCPDSCWRGCAVLYWDIVSSDRNTFNLDIQVLH